MEFGFDDREKDKNEGVKWLKKGARLSTYQKRGLFRSLFDKDALLQSIFCEVVQSSLEEILIQSFELHETGKSF